jgi:hypothetical protein
LLAAYRRFFAAVAVVAATSSLLEAAVSRGGREDRLSGDPAMPAYLVRTIDEHDIVGFFVADEMEDLLITIDECLDASDCEYIELPAGGIMWSSPAIAIPLNPGDDANATEAETLPWAKAELSESWWSVVYGYSDDEWTEFFPGSPRTPRPAAPSRGMGPAQVVPIRKPRA